MGGFIRRFGYFPGVDVITQVEGVVIVDLPPPVGISGVGTGTVAMVGEFADASSAVLTSLAGVVTSDPKPVEVFGSQDLIGKVGGFDATLGNFGDAGGNGFASLRNKRFSRLIVCPVDTVTPGTGSQWGVRFWRQLPTNQSATAAQPITPVSGGTVAAGTEFRSGSNRVRVAQAFTFSDSPAYATGVDGAVTPAGLPLATQTFTSAGANFLTSGVQVGDVVVVGVIAGAGALGTNANTYRVTAVTDANNLVLERLDGSNFTVGNWVAGTGLPWRIHAGATADTGPLVSGLHQALSGAGSYAIPCRPLDANVATATALAPTVTPTTPTANTWDVLSGLAGRTHPTGNGASVGLLYDANVHAPNAANNATLDARYQAAIDALLQDAYPARDANIVVASRKSATIRAKLKTHVATASSRGLTRTCVVSPGLLTTSLNAVLADADPGVGANRLDRLDYSWPGCTHSVPEAVGFTLATSDGRTTSDGVLDDHFDTWLASILSNIPPEHNPGEATSVTKGVLAPVLGLQRAAPKLDMGSYIQLRQAGVAALRMDRTAGPIVQSGVTTSLVSGEKNISRRRMADFIQDSMAAALVPSAKQLMTNQLKDAAVAACDAFLNELLSPNNPAAQRIAEYQVDDRSGNTPAMTAKGIFVIVVRVRLLPTLDFLVFQSDISEGTVIVKQVA